MKKGTVIEGKKISRGRERLLGGAEVTPGMLGLTERDFDALVKAGAVRTERAQRSTQIEREEEREES